MERRNRGRIGRHPEQAIQPCVDRNTVLHVEQSIVHAAHVKKAVVLGHPARQARERGLYALARKRLANLTDNVAGERPRMFGGSEAGVSAHDDGLGDDGAGLKRELHWEGSANHERAGQHDRPTELHPDDVRAWCNVRDPKRPVGLGGRAADGVARRILQHHGGVCDPGRLGIEDAPVKLRDLELCRQGEDRRADEYCKRRDHDQRAKSPATQRQPRLLRAHNGRVATIPPAERCDVLEPRSDERELWARR